MKKYFFMALAALATLTACQPDEPQTMVNDGTIKFMSAETRATVTDITTLATNGFNVYGYTTGANGYDVFNPTTATPTTTPAQPNTTVWNTDVTKYWAEGQTYDFVALYPLSVTGSYVIANRKTTVAFTGNAETDFVAATATAENVTTDRGAVALTFKHQLSRVAFKFVNAFTANDITVDVANVQLLAVPTSATFTYTAGTPWTTVISSPNSASVAYDGTTNLAKDGEYTTDYKYIVPTEGATTVAYKLSCNVTIKHNNGEVLKQFDCTGTNALTIGEVDYNAGLGYVFTTNISSTINPITFTVSVENWEDATGYDNEIDFPGN